MFGHFSTLCMKGLTNFAMRRPDCSPFPNSFLGLTLKESWTKLSFRLYNFFYYVSAHVLWNFLIMLFSWRQLWTKNLVLFIFTRNFLDVLIFDMVHFLSIFWLDDFFVMLYAKWMKLFFPENSHFCIFDELF